MAKAKDLRLKITKIDENYATNKHQNNINTATMTNLVKVDKPLDTDRKHARNKSGSPNNLSMSTIDTGSDKWLTDEILENGTSKSLKSPLIYIKTQIIESLMGLLTEIENKIFTFKTTKK